VAGRSFSERLVGMRCWRDQLKCSCGPCTQLFMCIWPGSAACLHTLCSKAKFFYRISPWSGQSFDEGCLIVSLHGSSGIQVFMYS